MLHGRRPKLRAKSRHNADELCQKIFTVKVADAQFTFNLYSNHYWPESKRKYIFLGHPVLPVALSTTLKPSRLHGIQTLPIETYSTRLSLMH